LTDSKEFVETSRRTGVPAPRGSGGRRLLCSIRKLISATSATTSWCSWTVVSSAYTTSMCLRPSERRHSAWWLMSVERSRTFSVVG